MKKALFIITLFNSLFMYSQLDNDIIKVKGISKSDEDQVKDITLSLIYETFDVRVSYKNEVITLKAFDLYTDLKKVTKINQVVIFNAEKKEVISQKFDSTEAKINAENLPKGIYNIYVKTDSGQVKKQFIKK